MISFSEVDVFKSAAEGGKQDGENEEWEKKGCNALQGIMVRGGVKKVVLLGGANCQPQSGQPPPPPLPSCSQSTTFLWENNPLTAFASN